MFSGVSFLFASGWQILRDQHLLRRLVTFAHSRLGDKREVALNPNKSTAENGVLVLCVFLKQLRSLFSEVQLLVGLCEVKL